MSPSFDQTITVCMPCAYEIAGDNPIAVDDEWTGLLPVWDDYNLELGDSGDTLDERERQRKPICDGCGTDDKGCRYKAHAYLNEEALTDAIAQHWADLNNDDRAIGVAP